MSAKAGSYNHVMRDEPEIRRNDPCYCGTGKKFKKCHGSKDGGEGIGVTANKPDEPRSSRSSALADPEPDSE